MTRILIAMPHYFGGAGDLAANRADLRAQRAAIVTRSISFLTAHFGRTFRLDFAPVEGSRSVLGGRIAVGKGADRLDIAVCTTGEEHLLGEVRLPAGVRQRRCDCDPAMLAFAAHDALAEGLGAYDWYCYVEDDIGVHDPELFHKLAWFSAEFGDGALLQPNRYEIFEDAVKVYVDGEPPAPGDPRWRHRPAEPLTGRWGARELVFRAPINPMAGCFFLNARQMERWAASPSFGSRDTGGFNPIEAAGFLGLREVFTLYRPVLANAGFLEVMHLHARLAYRPTPLRILQEAIGAGG